MYYSLEIPDGLEQVVPETGELAEILDTLVATWDYEVERARAAEAEVASAVSVPAGAATPAELDALRRSHRTLVETLERSISELEVLQQKTAGLVRLVAGAVRSSASGHGGLCLSASGPTEFPSNDDTEAIDEDNRRDLANLDVASRWRPLRRRRDQPQP